MPRREQTLQLIKSQLEQAGVEVQPTYIPSPTFFGTLVPSGEFDAVLFAWNVERGGIAVPEAICGDPLNFAGYCSRLTMRDVQQVDRIVRPSQRARVLNAVDRKLVRDVPLLPLFQPVVQVALKKTIRGWVSGGAPGNPFEHNEDWWLER